MKRREAVKAMGASLVGLPALDYMSRKAPTQREIVVNIYQNKSLTRLLKSRKRETVEHTVDVKQAGTEERLEDAAKIKKKKNQEPIEYNTTEMTAKSARRAVEKFDAYFSDIDFKIKFADFDVPLELNTHKQDLSSELDYLKKWMKYDDLDTPKSNESNIILVPSELFNGNSGVATTPIIPRVQLYDGHGIAWVNFNNPNGLHRVIAHEIGHTIGLQHYHGTKLAEDHASIMYSRKYAKNVGRNVYGTSLRPIAKKDKFKFNPKITEDTLRI